MDFSRVRREKSILESSLMIVGLMLLKACPVHRGIYYSLVFTFEDRTTTFTSEDTISAAHDM